MADGGNNGNVSESYWRALFQFANSVGANDPVNQQTGVQFRQMSDADRAFLTQAMSAFVKETDPVFQMKENLNVLMELDFHTQSEEELRKAICAVENISDLCTFVDNASDFYKIGGFRILPPLLASPHAQLRSEAANLIGELTQNNPFCQEKVKEAHLLSVLLELLDSDPDSDVRVKALFAIGSLIRHSQDLQMEAEFASSDGLRHLMNALQSGVEKLVIKGAFLLTYLFEHNLYKDNACDAGLAEQLCCLVVNADEIPGAALEHVLSALAALCRDCKKAQKICQREDLCLFAALVSVVEAAGTDPAKEEEKQRAKELLKLFDEPSSVNEQAQR